MIWFLRAMCFTTEFELAITPRSAPHYSRLRLDVEYWRAELSRKSIARGLK